MKRVVKLVLFAVIVVAVFFGANEGFRWYDAVETNDERYVGFMLFTPFVIAVGLMCLHQVMFQKPAR